MIPYLAQGANSSLEDGAVLGYLLGKASSKGQVKDALEMYQRLRKARGEAIVKESSRQVCSVFQLQQGRDSQLGAARPDNI
jgi:salicylate hydroxylase